MVKGDGPRMTADEATPSPAALWSRAIAGIPRDDTTACQEPETPEATPKDKTTPDKKGGFKEHQQSVNAATDAKLIASMQARIQREAEQRRQVRQMQMQAAQAPAPTLPNRDLIAQALVAARTAPQVQPRRQRREGLARLSAQLTPSNIKKWRVKKHDKR